MNNNKHSIRSSRRGAALLYAILASFAAATMVSMMFTLTLSSKKISDVSVTKGQARALAEGGVEQAKAEVRNQIANWSLPPPTGSVVINGETVNYTITPTGLNTIATDPSGIQTIVTGYELQARSTMQGSTFAAHRLVNAEAIPVFQFAVFYTNDLEINPGPNMTLAGRVHTNQDMFLNCGGTLSLNTNYVKAVGSIFRNRKDDPLLSQGNVRIRQYVDNPFSGSEPTSWFQMNSISQMLALGIPTMSGYDSAFTTGWDPNGNNYADATDWLPWGPGALSYWDPPAGYTGGYGNTVEDSAHGITNASVPYIGSIQMYEPVVGGDYTFNGSTYDYTPGTGAFDKGYYHQNAGLSIIADASGSTIQAYDGSGVPIALPAGVVHKKFYDARQASGGASQIDVIEICMSCLKANGMLPANGLLYAGMMGSGTGTNIKGIKLTNGGDIGVPLTVVSENSVYIQGNYNNVNKKGAAVIADAVNLLSNNWNDSKTSASGLPPALPTTFNVAIISGNQDTVTNGQYNGGLENLPRFHENWSGVTCTIRGSFVNTWRSGFADSPWLYGSNRYTAPNRAWSYDTAFNQVANLPPFTPMSVTCDDVAIW